MASRERRPERDVPCCRINKAGRVRLVVLCSGTAWIGWNGKAGQGSSRYGAMWCGWVGGLWHGRLLYGLFRFGRPGEARPGMARLFIVRHGWRVMVRLGAVLGGSVMYGFVRLARLVQDRYVLLSLGKVWQDR